MANAPEIPLYSPGYAGATALGGTPTTPVPMAPPGSTAPEAPGAGEDAGVSALNASGGATLADRMKASGSPFLPNFVTAANAAAKSDPEAAAAPGGWARTVLAGAMHGLAPAVAGLGNAAAVGEIPKGSGKLGGAFVGISRALNAGNQQAAQQKQQKFENQQKTEELDIRKQQNQALMAETHLRQIQLEQDIHKQSEAVRNAGIDTTKSLVKSYEDQGYTKKLYTYPELQKASQDPNFWDNHIGGKVAEIPEINSKGENTGRFNPQYATIDLRTAPPGAKSAVPDDKFISDANEAGVDLKPNTELTPGQHANVAQRIREWQAVQIANEESNGKIYDAKIKEQLQPDLLNPTVRQAYVSVSGRPIKGLTDRLLATDASIKTTQDMISKIKAQNPNDPRLADLQKTLDKSQSADNALKNVLQFGFSEAQRKDELSAQQEDERIKADRAKEAEQDRRNDIAAAKETQQKGLGNSYNTELKQIDNIRKPLDITLQNIDTLGTLVDQNDAAADALIAPALAKALVAGGGVRITQAEINQVLHGRSTLEDIKGWAQRIVDGKSVTDVQRAQIRAINRVQVARGQAIEDILTTGQKNLDDAKTTEDQRKAILDMRQQYQAFLAAKTTQEGVDAWRKAQQQGTQPQTAQPAKPAVAPPNTKVGDTKKFPNGAIGVWNGSVYEPQKKP